MGNVTKAQRERTKKRLEDELNQLVEAKASEKLNAMKSAVFTAVEDHWKSEWKDAVREMTNQIQIVDKQKSAQLGYLYSDSEVTFRNVPGLAYHPYSDVKSMWTWPQQFVAAPILSTTTTNSAAFELDMELWMKHTNSTSTRVRTMLGLSKLPYNLWNEVLRHLYSFFNQNFVPREHTDIEVVSARSELYWEAQVYILPQHYSPAIFYDVPCDRGWICLQDARGTKSLAFGLLNFGTDGRVRCFDDTFSERVMDVVTKHQAGKLVKIFFRSHKQKCEFAKELLKLTTCSVDDLRVRPLTKTIRPKSYWQQLNNLNSTSNQHDGNRQLSNEMIVAVSLHPFASTSELITWLKEEKKNDDHQQLHETRAREIFLFEQFTSYELETLFHFISQIAIEYWYILEASGSAREPSTCGRDSFPSARDRFNNLDDPNCLRGRLADAPVLKELELFDQQVAVCKSKFQQILFPSALTELIVDYFPFPSPPKLESELVHSSWWTTPTWKLLKQRHQLLVPSWSH